MNLDFDPNQVMWTGDRELARQMRERGELADAAALYAKVLGRPSARGDVELWIEAGELADELGESRVAITRLRHAVGVIPGVIPGPSGPADAGFSGPAWGMRAWEALAVALMHVGDFVGAGGAWWKCVGMDRHGVRPWAGLWVCAVSAGREGLAKRVEKRMEARSSRGERRKRIAELWVHGAMGQVRVEEAETPETPEARRLASGLGGKGAFVSPLVRLLRESERKLGRAAGRQPGAGRADVQYHLAVCHSALGQAGAAEAAARRAMAINPNYAAAKAMVGRAG